MKKEYIPLPNLARIKESHIYEMGGFGNSFDGRIFSAIIDSINE